MQVHILDPTLVPQMINTNIQNAAGSPIRFADLDGTSLQQRHALQSGHLPGLLNRVYVMQKRLAGQQQPSFLCLQLLGAQTLVTLVFVTDFLAMHWHCSQQRSLKQFHHDNYSLHTWNCTYTGACECQQLIVWLM